MKKSDLLFVFLILQLFASSFIADGAVYHVSKNGNDGNSGLSWSDSLLTVSAGINKAASGDSVWAAEGAYSIDTIITIDREISLYGGFGDNETTVTQRDLSKHRTIITGNNKQLNIKNYGTIDGICVTGMTATGSNGAIYNSGGMILNSESYSNSSSGIYNTNSGTISNCRIYSNSGQYYGGVSINSGSIISCEIFSNSSSFYGGGICNYSGTNEFTISNCNIYSNTAGDGGGICTSTYNKAGKIENCRIYSNSSNRGGGVYNHLSPYINCLIYSNSAIQGGGIYDKLGGTYSGCKVYSNITSSGQMEGEGGGIYIHYPYKYSSPANIENCIIYSNTSAASGGGVYADGGIITNCIIYSNSSDSAGGGIYNGYVMNCTVYANTAKLGSGGISSSIMTGWVYNSIIWNNVGPQHSTPSVSNGDDILYMADNIYNSCYKGGGAFGGDNISKDPLFVTTTGDDSATWNFHLQAGSPCIDTGTTTTAPLALDFDGISRPQGAGYDMGAYEFFLPAAGDLNIDSRITGSDTNMLQEFLNKKIAFSCQQSGLADVNNDSKIDIADLVKLINLVNK